MPQPGCFRFVLACLLCACCTSWAQPPSGAVTIAVPIFSQVVLFSVPKGWTVLRESKGPGHYQVEHVPGGQTAENWREMITVQGFQGMATRLKGHPRGLVNLVGTNLKSSCPEHFIAQHFGDGRIDGAETTMALIGCGLLPSGQSEVAFYLALRGSADMYLIHRSVRREGAAPKPFPKQEPAAWLSPLEPLRLCGRNETTAQCRERPAR